MPAECFESPGKKIKYGNSEFFLKSGNLEELYNYDKKWLAVIVSSKQWRSIFRGKATCETGI